MARKSIVIRTPNLTWRLALGGQLRIRSKHRFLQKVSYYCGLRLSYGQNGLPLIATTPQQLRIAADLAEKYNLWEAN